VDPVEALSSTLRGRRLLVLAGAGCSTESGIPDYRGPGTLARARKPVSFRSFVDDDEAYRRYWARSYVGWTRLAQARPNAAHHALAALEAAGRLTGLVTQNVDSLHSAAGSRRLVELHGALRDVICLRCGRRRDRAGLQDEMAATHPGGDAAPAPDGDADLVELGGFVAPVCACGGRWKPDVVFFGENVPRDRVDTAYAWLEAATDLLVVGSSLTVFSGWRFVKRAHESGRPIHVVNLGPTRADAVATTKGERSVGEVLPRLV
jgi:NAD-dependent SIR2 family protein deacetylase